MKMMVEHGFVPHMIEEKQWEGREQYEGRERDYVSDGGYIGVRQFQYSFYGTLASDAGDGYKLLYNKEAVYRGIVEMNEKMERRHER